MPTAKACQNKSQLELFWATSKERSVIFTFPVGRVLPLDKATISPAHILATLRMSALQITRRTARGSVSKASTTFTVKFLEDMEDILVFSTR